MTKRQTAILALAPALSLLLIGATTGHILWTQLASGSRHGTQLYGQSSDGTGASGDCAKFNSDGSLTDYAGSCAGTGFANPMTALGDLIVGGSSGTPERLGVGSNNQVLMANSSATYGINWAAPFSLTTTGSSGAATFSAGTLNIPQYSGGSGGLTFPFTVVQEGCWGTLTNSSSNVFTFPNTAASSGNTLFVLVAADASTTLTTPSGWTQGFNQTKGSYSRVAMYYKASASDTSVTFATSGSASESACMMELSGSHSLDQDSTGGLTGSSFLIAQFPSVTPTSGAAVFAIGCFIPNVGSPAFPPQPGSINPAWGTLFAAPGVGEGRTLVGWRYAGTSNGSSITPPSINLTPYGPYSSSGFAWSTFSII